MIKKLICVLCILLCSVLCTSCGEQKSIILFNHYPITPDNFLDNATSFKAGQRIYFLYATKKNLETEDIRVRIYELKVKAKYAIGSMVYSNDFRLKPGEINYFTDYIVMHKPGNYLMMVFKKDYLWKPDAEADFNVVAK